MAPPSLAAELRGQFSQRWNAFAPRERVMVGSMAFALVFLIVWLVAVRPAWRTLSEAPAKRAQADAQLFEMQAIAAEARQLRALPPVPSSAAEQALKSATERLGAKGKVVVQNDKATLTLTGATGEDIRQWLSEARGGARARPIEANLTRSGDAYNGTLVVALGSP
ncbi:MAG TPA: type II secretion system protein GspM [Burkholderiaceae bacterium]|nr:type II secretion system protein GspM [Burkholderiaceae bacterium]